MLADGVPERFAPVGRSSKTAGGAYYSSRGTFQIARTATAQLDGAARVTVMHDPASGEVLMVPSERGARVSLVGAYCYSVSVGALMKVIAVGTQFDVSQAHGGVLLTPRKGAEQGGAS